MDEKLMKKEEIERNKIIDRQKLLFKQESNEKINLIDQNMKKINILNYKQMLDEQILRKKPLEFMTQEEKRINVNLIKEAENLNKSNI